MELLFFVGAYNLVCSEYALSSLLLCQTFYSNWYSSIGRDGYDFDFDFKSSEILIIVILKRIQHQNHFMTSYYN